MKSKLFEYVLSLIDRQPLREMALMALIRADPRTLPKGMRIEVITTEYKGTGEEQHFHLFPANHISRKGKANNYDLITRVALPEKPPNGPEEIYAITNNPIVPKEYQRAIYEWSRSDDEKTGCNNWKLTRTFWERQAASVKFG